MTCDYEPLERRRARLAERLSGRQVQPTFQNLEAYKFERWRPDDGRNLALSLSGGRSSAYKIWHIIEANGGLPPGAIVNFENSGREWNATLDFVDMIDKTLGLDVHYLEYDPTAKGKVKRVDYFTAARNGEPFRALLDDIVPKRRDGTAGIRPLPNPTARICTASLKVKTLHRYVRHHLGWGTQYYSTIGYRADEKSRWERRVKSDQRRWEEGGRGLFPMYHAGATEIDVQRFWLHAPFDLDLDSAHGNCDFCFMVSTWKLKERMVLEALRHQIRLVPGALPPPRLQAWIDDEERLSDRPGSYRRDRPGYRDLWKEVCDGNMQSSVPEGKEDRCGSCTD